MINDQTHIYVIQNLTMIYQMEYVELWPFKHLKSIIWNYINHLIDIITFFIGYVIYYVVSYGDLCDKTLGLRTHKYCNISSDLMFYPLNIRIFLQKYILKFRL